MLMPILQVNSEDIPEFVIVCGDPKRAEVISRKLEGARELAFSREYRTFVGTYEGVEMAVTSHGVGCPGAAVCFEELIRAGAKTLIRVGTAGSYHADIPAGSLVVSTSAIRTDGLTKQLVPEGFPAVADSEVAEALYASALSMGEGVVRKGMTVTLDVFFNGVEEVPHAKYKVRARSGWRWKSRHCTWLPRFAAYAQVRFWRRTASQMRTWRLSTIRIRTSSRTQWNAKSMRP
ncbi:uridine phosphorylase [Paenibacillus sp. JCM 10914]|nr:uridine phosphorylase [Paenibacillus sp. JCM 10914]